MPTGEKKSNATKRSPEIKRDTTPDDFPAELRGEFEDLPQQLSANIGTVARAAVLGGGYFGISVTDDGGSVRLAIRHGNFAIDRRFYDVRKLESALAYCIGKLREPSAAAASE
jgi:hypothetical protein